MAAALAFVVVSSAVAYGGGGHVLAALLGAIASPGIACAWHVVVGRARAGTPTAGGLVLRTSVVAAVAVAGVALVLRGNFVRALREQYDWPVRALRGDGGAAGLEALSPRTRGVLHLVGDDAISIWIVDERYAGDDELMALIQRAVPVPIVSERPPPGFADVLVENRHAGGLECTSLAGERRPYPPEGVLALERDQPRLRVGDMVCRWSGQQDAMARARAALTGHLPPTFEEMVARVPPRAFFVLAMLGDSDQPFRDLVLAASAQDGNLVLSGSAHTRTMDDVSALEAIFRAPPVALGGLHLRDRVTVDVDGTLVTGRVEVTRAELETMAANASHR